MPAYRGGIVKRRVNRKRMYGARRYASRPIAMRAGGWVNGPGARGELKQVDTTVSTGTSVLNATGGIQLLNGIARGDDINQRNGRQVTISALHLRLQASVTVSTGVDQVARVLVVMDQQPNGAALTIANVLDNSASYVYAQYNRDYRMRFRVLRDMTFQLNAAAESGSQRFINARIPVNAVMTFNNGNAGTIADIATNSVYLITVGSENAGATAGSCSGTVRCFFTDK